MSKTKRSSQFRQIHKRMEKKIEIKPSSPTPHHKKSVKLSLLDQLAIPTHTKTILFYPPPPPPPPPAATINPQQQRHLLTTSLSEVLTQFYPYAGRFKDNSSIECTDDGVVYSEADHSSLTDVLSLSKRDLTVLDQFLPSVDHLDEILHTIPLLIQANFFNCGGLALGFLASHRIIDGVGLSTFIRSWAIAAMGHRLEGPDFTIPSSLYPPSESLNYKPKKNLFPPPNYTCVTKRFVFDGSNITKLKAKLGTSPQPTRVEAVSSLIWKSAMKASHHSSSMLQQIVDMRKRWDPPLQETAPGNHLSYFSAYKRYENELDEHEEEVCGLVYLLKDGLREFRDNYMKKLQDKVAADRPSVIFEGFKKTMEMSKGEDRDLYVVSSWCRFKLYDADFGWGKPEWIGFPASSSKNVMLLMDTKEGDGIEAWVTLEEQHMAAFERDDHISMFAC